LTQLSLFALLDPWLAPAPAPVRVAFLKGVAYAHRGLHGGAIVENSRAAFVAAIDGGFGIELDVEASRDGDAFVFHDEELDRLTPMEGRVGACYSRDLDQIRLTGTDETIPRLHEILALIAGRATLLIEIKTGRRDIAPLCKSVRHALEGYDGPVAIMSFNPDVCRWFHDHAPGIVRGLVVTEEGSTALPDRSWAALTRQLALWRAKPEFLAYDVQDFPARLPQRQRARGLPILSWTVRTEAERATAARYADGPIFEIPGP
jgi:glycerophosphoryl diester phosphodiesterase